MAKVTSEEKALSPQDIIDDLGNIIPKSVIQGVNNLLKLKYRGDSVVLYQNEIIKEIMKIEKQNNGTLTRQQLFDNHYMDFEPIFSQAGWKVVYDNPGYNETYEANFTFTPKPKQPHTRIKGVAA